MLHPVEHTTQAQLQMIAKTGVISRVGNVLATLAQLEMVRADDLALLCSDNEPAAAAPAAGTSTSLPLPGPSMPVSQVHAIHCQDPGG